MKRREFITLLGGAAVWPVAGRAQQAERVRRIGVINGGGAADDPETLANIAAFLQVLQQLGWTDGRNVRIDTRLAGGNADSIRKYAAELSRSSPTRSAPVSSRAWRGRAATLPALCSSNTV